MGDAAAYFGLFLSAFTSATLLPGSSEALLAGLVAAETGAPALLLAAATVGNVLGSVVNWGVGRFLVTYRDRKWFPVSARRYDQAARWYQRFGVWTLLLAWLPVVGDPLTLVAGALRAPFGLFLVLVTIGKFGRYLFVLAAALAWFG